MADRQAIIERMEIFVHQLQCDLSFLDTPLANVDAILAGAPNTMLAFEESAQSRTSCHRRALLASEKHPNPTGAAEFLTVNVPTTLKSSPSTKASMNRTGLSAAT